ncbi:MAG: aldo/keto reductase [Thermoleophilia bacterium]|nr:aldo/keto reductase [Actinomycetota bacterium]MDH5224051.1 aldo/keto reductase [Actinomycetota bacterium]MDH5280014.1 aldo/keto reductase [Thermoleophilia bacterium]
MRIVDLVDAGARIGLGCMPMSFGYVDAASEDEPASVIGRALDLGVTMFDTADVYGPFTNEELLGRSLVERRSEAIIATKVGLVVGPNGGYPLSRDARPERIRDEVHGSLRRLRTDVIDLYYLHRVDEHVPIEESWGALSSLVEAGFVRAIGLSEVSVEQLDRARSIHPVSAVQSELSVWTRGALDGVIEWCERHGSAFVAFSPLGRGFLTGTIADGRFDDRDFRSTNPRFTDESIAANQAIVRIVRDVAERHGATPAQVALAWTLAQSPNVLAIPGTKRLRYLEENVEASTLELTATDLADLDAAPASDAPRY